MITQHCVRCHGALKEEAGLRMDTADSMRLGGSSGSILRRPAGRESLLLEVITGRHEDIPAMPYKKPALPAADIATVRAWIDQGAK
jgi:mono/diheme cytochrome c family protein